MDNGKMRILCSLMLVGGCVAGDNQIVSPPDMPPGPNVDSGDMMGGDEIGDPSAPNYLFADICDARAWDITPDAKDIHLAIVPTQSGATVLTVPRDGGAIRGFRVDNRARLFDRDMQTIRDDRNYTSVSANIVADRLVVSSLVDDKIALDIVSDDLAQRHELGDVSGTLISPMVSSRETQIAVVGGPEGVFASTFSGGLWEPMGTSQLLKTPIVSMAAMTYHDDALIAFSTPERECHLQHLATTKDSVVFPGCDNAKFAVDEATGLGLMVYEEAGNLYRTDIAVRVGNELSNTQLLAEQASSPRVVFDGRRVWASYLNAHGDIIVGFMDHGAFRSRALEGVRPSPEAYDLAVFDGGVWVVSVELDAFLGERICAVVH